MRTFEGARKPALAELTDVSNGQGAFAALVIIARTVWPLSAPNFRRTAQERDGACLRGGR
jgi:hypothetical protein